MKPLSLVTLVLVFAVGTLVGFLLRPQPLPPAPLGATSAVEEPSEQIDNPYAAAPPAGTAVETSASEATGTAKELEAAATPATPIPNADGSNTPEDEIPDSRAESIAAASANMSQGEVRPEDSRKLSKVAERAAAAKRGNLAAFVTRSKSLDRMTPALAGLLGRFEGEVLLDEDSKKTWGISVVTEGRFVQNRFEGRSVAQLSRNGRPFATSSSDGTLKNLKYGTGKDMSVLIEISPNYFLDAYYDGEQDSLYGNLYVKGANEKVRARGFAQLARVP